MALPLTLLLLFAPAFAQKDGEIRFFYSPLLDSCEWGPSNTFTATNNTENGGVCAYNPALNRLYACPAPDNRCWAFNQNCKSGKDSPGSDQILCGSSNQYQWCCADYETCTTLPGQVRLAPFCNPHEPLPLTSSR